MIILVKKDNSESNGIYSFAKDIHVVYLAQDDRKKNTAVRLSKKGMITMHDKISKTPRKGILLNPLSGKILGPEDHYILKSGGKLIALDCSWRLIEESLEYLSKRDSKKTGLLHLLRRQPWLFAFVGSNKTGFLHLFESKRRHVCTIGVE